MKLLIVDDQPGVTEGLCHGVNWAQLLSLIHISEPTRH